MYQPPGLPASSSSPAATIQQVPIILDSRRQFFTEWQHVVRVQQQQVANTKARVNQAAHAVQAAVQQARDQAARIVAVIPGCQVQPSTPEPQPTVDRPKAVSGMLDEAMDIRIKEASLSKGMGSRYEDKNV
eukprot:449889-Lingulodinium_polyedra.AAC.2